MDEKGKGLMSSFGFAAKEVFLIVSQTFCSTKLVFCP